MIRYWIAYIIWEVRWFWWMWRYPSPISLHQQGLDQESRMTIYRRYDMTAPVKPEHEDAKEPTE